MKDLTPAEKVLIGLSVLTFWGFAVYLHVIEDINRPGSEITASLVKIDLALILAPLSMYLYLKGKKLIDANESVAEVIMELLFTTISIAILAGAVYLRY